MKIYLQKNKFINSLKYKKQFKQKSILTKVKKFLVIITLCLFLMFFYKFYSHTDISVKNLRPKKRLKIGVVGVAHIFNVGNNMIKYAISVVLSNLGFEPYIIGSHPTNYSMEFLKKTTNVITRNNFSEIKPNDYDILMVNSDQTWRKYSRNSSRFLDIGFLKFAQDWNIKKFVYGASIGFDYWDFSPTEDLIMKKLLKNFTGVSVREMGSIKLIQRHLGITPELVLDPTLLIDKKYYLKLIKDYRNNNDYNINNYIFIYTFGNIKKPRHRMNRLYEELILRGEKIYDYNLHNNQTIEDFLYYISNCKAVVTESFHGTIFSIIFNKPFITIARRGLPLERFKSLGKLLDIENRIIYYNNISNINLLSSPLNVNYSLIEELKIRSINYLKKNLK